MSLRPIVIIPYNQAKSAGAGLSDEERNFINASERIISEDIGLKDWTWAVTAYPALMKEYVESIDSPGKFQEILQKISRIILEGRSSGNLELGNKKLPRATSRGGKVDITTYPQHYLPSYVGRWMGKNQNSMVQFIFNPETGRHQVELQRFKPRDEFFIAEVAMESWRASSLVLTGQLATCMRDLVSDNEVLDMVAQRARMLVIPNGARLVLPYRIYISSLSGDDNVVAHFSIRAPGQTELGVPTSTEVKLSGGFTENVSAAYVLERLERSATTGFERAKKIPTMFLDIDGTLFNVRRFTRRLFDEWLASYDGPRASEIKKSISEKEDLGVDLLGWNAKDILAKIGVFDEEIVAPAQGHHDKHFFDPSRRVEGANPIWGTINLVKLLRRRLQKKGIPLRTVYVSLRSDQDDSLPNGLSAAELALRYVGLWDENSEPLFHKGAKIDWSSGSQKEPEKMVMVREYLASHKEVWHVAFMDNTPNHLNGYSKLRGGGNGIRIHVQGDMPPGAAGIGDGILTTDPVLLARELESIGGIDRLDFEDLPAVLRQEQTSVILERLRQAKEAGVSPVVVADIDDERFSDGFVHSAARFLHDIRALESDIIYIAGRRFAFSGAYDEALKLNGYPLMGNKVSVLQKDELNSVEEMGERFMRELAGRHIICSIGSPLSVLPSLTNFVNGAPHYMITGGIYSASAAFSMMPAISVIKPL
ncbi:MAG TPA: hypothetical protein PKU96_05405 [bacterium]|jgi:hypothetical protein|nr:MAG: hypothetical protein BWY40_00232 [bacterium ADurb.Bin270]HPW45788.1 hypothetical protein [bacterium]HQG13108.1 hypothetical protein [bacterium]HQH80110.1 hypothetical protein [bacterium]